MVEIKHIQQQNDGCNWKCGVVCLEMIFDYYKIPCKQDDVWNAVKTRPCLKNDNTLYYFNKMAIAAIMDERQE